LPKSDFFNNNDQNRDKRTNVLDTEGNVSRETLATNPRAAHGEEYPPNYVNVKEKRRLDDKKRLEKYFQRKDRGDSIRKEGKITDNNPYDFDNPTMKQLYKLFRKNGLSKIESWYNAAYLRCSDNYYSSGVGVKKKYENVYSHPMAWFGNATTMWRHNKWSVAMKLLEIPAVVGKGIHGVSNGVSKALGGFSRSAESSGSVKRSVSGLLSLMLMVGTATVGTYWWTVSAQNSTKVPVLQLYVDGEHVGNVMSIAQVNEAKRTVEDTISNSLGTSYSLGCEIRYVSARADSSLVLNDAKLHKILHETAHESMILGYCLYKGDLPICAMTEKDVLEQCILESIKFRFPELVVEDDVQNIEYKDFVIRQGVYPDSLFVNESQLRFLLALPQSKRTTEDAGGENGGDAASLSITEGTLLNSGEHSVGSSSDVASTNPTSTGETVSVTIEAVVTRNETVTEIIPFTTEYIYDDVLPEGYTSPISSGRNGVRVADYSVDYTDGKETARRLISEEIISEPVNAVKKMGTRPLTEEEKQYKSTGTYIYPSQGELSSTYGWRVLGGQNEFHKGVDMRSDQGLEIVASDGGTVIQAGDRYNGYGLCILIEHDDGTITRYAHCSELYVAESQKVKQGQLIAKMGSTGFATGVHIHFEMIKNGMTVNPMDYLIPR